MGGYDAARFNPSNVSFSLAADISRDLVVGLQSITSVESNRSTQLLLPSAHLTFIDSTVPEIFLPIDACMSFERAYGLVWNTTYEMYVVDDELHANLLMRDPVFTFEIGDFTTGGPTVEIVLPYSSFDLKYMVRLDLPPIQYFPIQRAMNDSQLTLGRVFLQEAYLITDYERGNFSVSQCRFEEPINRKILPILPVNANLTTDPSTNQTTINTSVQGGSPNTNQTTSNTSVRGGSPNLDRSKIAGIVAGTVLGLLLMLTLCCWPCILRRHRRRKVAKTKAVISSAEEIRGAFEIRRHASDSSVDQSIHSNLSIKGCYRPEQAVVTEIARNSYNLLREVPENNVVELPENAKRFELPHPIRAATFEHLVQQMDAKSGHQPPMSSRKRRGLILSTSGILSWGNIVRYWMKLNGLRSSQSEISASLATPTTVRSKPPYMEKSLPPTPISESPQESAYPAWTRVGARRHEEHSLYPPPLRLREDPYRHRTGFF